jgi:hypothetical protein
MGEAENRAAAEELAAAFGSGDPDRMRALFDRYIPDDYVQEWPQSGERIRGKDNARAILENYPGMPKGELKGIRGSGDLWVLEATLDYGQGPVHMVSVAEMRDGMIAKQTDYFAEPFEAPAWRKQWVEQM